MTRPGYFLLELGAIMPTLPQQTNQESSRSGCETTEEGLERASGIPFQLFKGRHWQYKTSLGQASLSPTYRSNLQRQTTASL